MFSLYNSEHVSNCVNSLMAVKDMPVHLTDLCVLSMCDCR